MYNPNPLQNLQAVACYSSSSHYYLRYLQTHRSLTLNETLAIEKSSQKIVTPARPRKLSSLSTRQDLPSKGTVLFWGSPPLRITSSWSSVISARKQAVSQACRSMRYLR